MKQGLQNSEKHYFPPRSLCLAKLSIWCENKIKIFVNIQDLKNMCSFLGSWWMSATKMKVSQERRKLKREAKGNPRMREERCQNDSCISVMENNQCRLEEVRRISEIFFQDDNDRTPEKSKSI